MSVNLPYRFQPPLTAQPLLLRESRKSYLVGIEYDCPHEGGGYFDFRRSVTMEDLAREVLSMIRQGHSFPTFPPSANPSIVFACDLDDNNRDCRVELIATIKKLQGKLTCC